jgi:hypothetical protein
VEGQELFTIGAPLREQKRLISGTVGRVESRFLTADFRLPSGSAGGPVFTADGAVVGVTSIVADDDEPRRGDSSVDRIEAACDVVASAEKQIAGAKPPDGTHLPVEPARPFPASVLEEAERLASSPPPQMTSADFEIAFITPVLIRGAQAQAARAQGRERGARASASPDALRPLTDFSHWSEYVADLPAVLMIRARPKFVERFWTRVARGAASTQGVALPPIKRFKAGFSRMRVVCGGADVTPIHPFTLEQRTSETEAIQEGLYVFAHDAIGPQCGTVDLVLYSEKAPEKGDSRRVDPAVLQRVWQDFAPYRASADTTAR